MTNLTATPDTAGAKDLRPGVIVTNGWAGRREWPCTVMAETKTRYRVRLDRDAHLPTGHRPAGDLIFVPKTAVTFR